MRLRIDDASFEVIACYWEEIKELIMWRVKGTLELCDFDE